MPYTTVALKVSNLILTGTSSCLSILGAAVIFITYSKIPQIRNFTRRLLIYLTVADLFTALGNLVATVRYAVVHASDGHNEYSEINCTFTPDDFVPPKNEVCQGQSFVTTTSNLCSFFWTFIIALHISVSVLRRTQWTEGSVAHAAFHGVSWIIPLAIVVVVLQKGYLGEDYCFGTGVWCGIRSNLHPDVIELWMYIADVAWQLACYVSTCFLYIWVKFFITLKKKHGHLREIAPNLRNEDENFVFVWMIIYLLKIWGLVRFFITTYTNRTILDENQSLQNFLDFLLLMQSYGASGQAFWNCILFCVLDRTVRQWLITTVRGRRDSERQLLLNPNRRFEDSSVERSLTM